jgi:hypothetical protein
MPRSGLALQFDWPVLVLSASQALKLRRDTIVMRKSNELSRQLLVISKGFRAMPQDRHVESPNSRKQDVLGRVIEGRGK